MSASNSEATRRNGDAVAGTIALLPQRVCVLSALLILPAFLGAVAFLAARTHLQFLLFPPLAAIGYAMFSNPYGSFTQVRNAVLGPVVGALIGVAGESWVPAGPLRVMVVAAGGIVALRLLRIELPPSLAVALLTLLVGAEGWVYVLSILASSLALTMLFRLWRRFIYARLAGTATPRQAAQSRSQDRWALESSAEENPRPDCR